MISLHLTIVKFIPACTHVFLNEDLARRKLTFGLNTFLYAVSYAKTITFLLQGKATANCNKVAGENWDLDWVISFPSFLIQKCLGEIFILWDLYVAFRPTLQKKKSSSAQVKGS